MTELPSIAAVVEQSELLFSQPEVEAAITKIAQQITSALADKNPIMLCVMNGGLIFTGKLLSQLSFPLQVDYCHATRYRGETQGGELQWKALPQLDLSDRTVVLLDDIYDEGYTLIALLNAIKAQGAKEVYSAVLTDKKHDRKAEPDFQPDFIGLPIPDRYVFGYGMDYQHYWRNAPAIYAVKGL